MSSTIAPSVALADGRMMPRIGLGVWSIPSDAIAQALESALRTGYRSFDTASQYGNETEVGNAVLESEIPRSQIFVTTKVWNTEQGYDRTLRAFDESLGRLGLDYVDLYLIHWPQPEGDLYLETWRALETLKEQGRTRSIGVSNFNVEHLERLHSHTGVSPAVNQVELHPLLQQRELRRYHDAHGIVTAAWSPLARGRLLENPVVARLAAAHGVSAAQVILRWHVQCGGVAIPRSADSGRIRENYNVFGFELSPAEMRQVATLDAGTRVGAGPPQFRERP